MASTRQLRSSKRQTASQPPMATVSPHLGNTRGLPCLADEIYLEILSYFPAFPIPTEHQEQDIELYGHRRLALDALSHTCRSLRRVFLPYRWQRIEVYERMDLGQGPLPQNWYKKNRVLSSNKLYATELLRQLEMVTVRNSSLAAFVNVLDILVVNYSVKSVLSELVRCIALLPNLHTAQICFDVGQGRLIEEAFSDEVYPQIHSAWVTKDGYPFLYSCPNIKQANLLKPDGFWDEQTFLNDISLRCSSIETLGPIPISRYLTPDVLDYYISLVARLENLHNITFKMDRLPSDSHVDALWKIATLQTLRLIFTLTDHEVQEIEEWKARMGQHLSRTPKSAEGHHKAFIVTIV